MKCPKCGYHSFEHLDNCKKCGQDLSAHKEKFNLRGFFAAGQTTAAASVAPVADDTMAEQEETGDDSVDFGFDFLDEEQDPVAEAPESVALGDDSEDVSIDQPFGADSETLPADDFDIDEEDDSDDKPGKGPEFAF